MLAFTSFFDYVTYLHEKFSQTSAWKDQQTSALTTIIADAFADMAAGNDYSITFAARENFIQLAKRESSIYAGARFLGVPITRKGAAATKATLLNSSMNNISLSDYSPFTVSSKPAYTKKGIVIPAGSKVDLELFLGEVVTDTLPLSNVGDFYTVLLNAPNFVVGFIEVWTQDALGNKVLYSEFDGGLFEAGTSENIYTVATLPDGDVQIQFGSNLFGRVPDKGHTLFVRYSKNNGAIDNMSTSGVNVDSVLHSALRGKTTEGIAGGSDLKPIDYYQNAAPILGAGKRKALIRLDQWEAAIRLYAGVADCAVLGQREVAPNDKAWMGTIRLCVLPESGLSWGGVNPNPTSAKWEEFLVWLAQYRSPLEIQKWNPSRLLIDVTVDIKVTKSTDIAALESEIRKAIADLFKRKRGVLGRRLALDDISQAINFKDGIKREGIDYINILEPNRDIIPSSRLEFVDLRNLRISLNYSERA